MKRLARPYREFPGCAHNPERVLNGLDVRTFHFIVGGVLDTTMSPPKMVLLTRKVLAAGSVIAPFMMRLAPLISPSSISHVASGDTQALAPAASKSTLDFSANALDPVRNAGIRQAIRKM
jgi:hypothetical protein